MASKARPHLVFLVLGSIFGLNFLITTPPFQVPDETNYFLKEYQISTGQLKGLKENDRVGGYVPHAVDSFSSYFVKMQGAMYKTTTHDIIWSLEDLMIQTEKCS